MTELWLTAAEKAQQKKLRNSIEHTVRDVDTTVKDMQKDVINYEKKVQYAANTLENQAKKEWSRNFDHIGDSIDKVAAAAKSMTTISISESDEAALQQKVAALGTSWNEFAQEKKIDQQVQVWAQKN